MAKYRLGKESWAVMSGGGGSSNLTLTATGNLASNTGMTIVDVFDNEEEAIELATHFAAKYDRTYYIAHVNKKAEPEKAPVNIVELKEN